MVSLNAHFLPSLTTPEQLSGATAVVIDVLRASTTIIQALAAGATSVRPCLSVDDALEFARQGGDDVLLGGERRGVKIPGFDLGNSPQEYVPATVCNKTIAFTTTNGTKALLRCQSASRVLIGSFVNLSSLCGSLSDSHQTELVCAGTDNEITFEDVLFAGAVTEKLRQAWPEIRLNDQAAMAAELWRHTESQESNGLRLVDWLRRSRGGRNLVELGFEGDIRFAAEVDKYNLVPCVEMAGLRITADRKLDP